MRQIPAGVQGFATACLAVVCLASGCESKTVDTTPTGCTNLRQVQKRLGATVTSPVPGVYSLDLYLVDGDQVLGPDIVPCTTEVAARLTEACDFCNRSPAQCEPLIRAIFDAPPGSCAACGDAICQGPVENAENCAQDCRAVCGDRECSLEETPASCPMDCDSACGDGLCTTFETPETCRQDCDYSIGDGFCSPGESPTNSPADCQRLSCGDGFCQSYESSVLCPEDCCAPLVCNRDDAAGGQPFCVNEKQLGFCQWRGEGACPEVVITETCDIGCGDTGVGLGCLTCPSWILQRDNDPTNDITLCDPSQVGRCAGDAVVLCEALPGFPECFVERTVDCSVAIPGQGGVDAGVSCSQGYGCSSCPAGSCMPGVRRCTGGLLVEECVSAGNGACGIWSAVEACTGWDHCDNDGRTEVKCDSCCGVGARVCTDGLSVEECVLEPGANCAQMVVVETCEAGWRCNLAPYGTCVECCTPGTTRCAPDLTRVETCQDMFNGCGTWVQSQGCGQASCMTDPETMQPRCMDCCDVDAVQCTVCTNPSGPCLQPCLARDEAHTTAECVGYWSSEQATPCASTCGDVGGVPQCQ